MKTIIFKDIQPGFIEYFDDFSDKSFSTFEKSGVKPAASDTNNENIKIAAHLLKNAEFYEKSADQILLIDFGNQNNKLLIPKLDNGLLGTIAHAYSCHIPLALRADDIWHAIITNFGLYIKTHAEQLRDIFVNHDGVKTINVDSNICFENATTGDWNILFNSMAEKINANIRTSTADWIKPDFTTTTQTDIAISNICLMGAMREYFSPTFTFMCGLSQVTLLGTDNDWKRLCEKARALRDYNIPDLANWCDLLVPVLEKIYESCVVESDAEIDYDFWQRICTSTSHGSGSQQTYRGWFLVFAPFNKHSKYILRSAADVFVDHVYAIVNDNDIPECAINVPMIAHNNGVDQNIVLYAGILLSNYDTQTNTLNPIPGWIMISKNDYITRHDTSIYRLL